MKTTLIILLLGAFTPRIHAQDTTEIIAHSVNDFVPRGFTIQFDSSLQLRHGPFRGHLLLIINKDSDQSELLLIESRADGYLQLVGKNGAIAPQADREVDEDFDVADSNGYLLLSRSGGRSSSRARDDYWFCYNRLRHQFELIKYTCLATYTNSGDTEIGFEDYRANYLLHRHTIEWDGESAASLKKPKISRKLFTFDELDSDEKLLTLRPPEW